MSYDKKLELGQKSAYDAHYNPDKLFPIPRRQKREEIGINDDAPPFAGVDYWNHYEVSWLNPKGKPVNAVAEIIYDCRTPNIIESKSMKLYFNTFNNTKFDDAKTVAETIKRDLSAGVGGEVIVHLHTLGSIKNATLHASMEGECIDDLDVECDIDSIQLSQLKTEEADVEEVLYSDLLKSNCLVTFQPDWASVQISYKGKKINREGLLKYLVSFRNHNEFHEQCIERIFADIMRHCKPESLTVYGRYTRRGGLDINPYRTTESASRLPVNLRLVRQ